MTNICSPFQNGTVVLPIPVPIGVPIPIKYLLAPIFMMTMCARGFVLWLMNVGLVIYLGAAATKLYKKVR